MRHISEIIELAYRVHDGMPNPKNAQHIHELRESMGELNLPNKVIYEVIKNLISEDDIVKNKESGNTYVVKKHNPNTQDLIKKDASDDDIKKVEKDDNKETDTTSEEIKQNQKDIFNNDVSGKGGGKTSVQEEITGISRKIAQENPDDSPEEHKRKVTDYIKKHYGDTHWGKKQKTMDKLINKSVSGLSTMKKIKANKGMK